jgi:hypothetical protein
MTHHPLQHPAHPLVDIDGRAVYFDTGSPVSYLPERHADLRATLGLGAHELHLCSDAAFARVRAVAEKLTGQRVDALLGMDVIARIGLDYDRPNGTLAWGVAANAATAASADGATDAAANDDGFTLVATGHASAIPVAEFEVAGRRLRAFLDTGCHADGYIDGLPSDLPDAGMMQDHNPIIGAFSVRGHIADATLLCGDGTRVPLGESRLGDIPHQAKGLLPALSALSAKSAPPLQGVLGGAVFRYRRVRFIGNEVFVARAA